MKVFRLGRLSLAAVLGYFCFSPFPQATSAGDHHKKVVQLVPYPTTVGYAPVAPYPYPYPYPYPGAVANAPVGGFANAPTVGYYPASAPATTTIIYGNAPQQATYATQPGTTYGTGTYGNAPGFQGSPVQISGSRLSADGLRDVFVDLQTDYETSIKKDDASQVGRRGKLTSAAKDKYVTAIGDPVTSTDDLNKSETQEIQGLVDLVMRTDAQNTANSPNNGMNYGPNYGSYGTGFAPVGPMAPVGPVVTPPLYYYYYPAVPAKKHLHKHHHNNP